MKPWMQLTDECSCNFRGTFSGSISRATSPSCACRRTARDSFDRALLRRGRGQRSDILASRPGSWRRRACTTPSREGRAAFPTSPIWRRPASRTPRLCNRRHSPGATRSRCSQLRNALTREHAFFHRRSRTLVVADLVFIFRPRSAGWPRLFVRQVMRLSRLAGMSVFFRLTIRDRAAFARSLQRLLACDFDRVVVAHREPILTDARATLEQSFAALARRLTKSWQTKTPGARAASPWSAESPPTNFRRGDMM